MFAGMILAAAAAHAAEAPAPAASLLLPRFEVSIENPTVLTTFTVTNVSDLPQIVRVMLHTDRGYAIVWYSTAVLPHESKMVNLRRFLVEGMFDQRALPASPVNPKLAADAVATCAEREHSGRMSSPLLSSIRYLLTSGCVAGFFPCTATMGHRHAHAIGYAVIDLMTCCSTDARTPLLDDAALTGTFEQYAGGRLIASGPLVPLPMPSSVTLRVPPGEHDIVVWHPPQGEVSCGKGDQDVFEVQHVNAKRPQTLTFRRVWAMVAEPMPPDPDAAAPPSGCPGVLVH